MYGKAQAQEQIQKAIPVDNAPGMVWRAQKGAQVVYLAGSLHLLTAKDYPLPAPYEIAYQSSKTVCFETHPAEWSLHETLVALQRLGRQERGRKLSNDLPPALWQRVKSYAVENDLSITLIENLRPWWAGLQLQRAGYSSVGMLPEYGMEAYFAHQAAVDHRTARSLEPAKEQVGAFASMDLNSQVSFLRSSLVNKNDLMAFQQQVRSAWRSGSIESLARSFAGGDTKEAQFHDVIMVKRHQAWTKRIVAMAAVDSPLMVIIGAQHLVDPSGNMIEKLTEQGFSIQKLVP